VHAIRRSLASGVALVVAASVGAARPASRAGGNVFANGDFEMGRSFWRLDKAEGTAASFAVDKAAAGSGRFSGLVTVGKVAEWGVQFGQFLDAGRKGSTWTFAGLARAVGGPVKVRLEVERHGKPYDRAGKTEVRTLTVKEWTELHVTFKVGRDFPEGWFAYISCEQANCRFRADAFRLYEGPYVPHAELARRRRADAGVRLFDTAGKLHSALPVKLADGPPDGWTLVPPEKTDHAFKGGALLHNDRIALWLQGDTAALGSVDEGVLTWRCRVGPVGRAESVKIVRNGPARVVVETIGNDAAGRAAGLALEMQIGQPFVRAGPRGSATVLAVSPGKSRYVVLPDFHADDIVLGASDLPEGRAALPVDHFFLHTIEGPPEALLAVVRDRNERDVRVARGSASPGIACSEVPFGRDGHVWLALLSGEGLWHERRVAAADAGKVLRLEWTAPFPAQWRVDWRRPDGLTDSWEMLLPRRGGFTKPGWFGSPRKLPVNRKRWTTVLGHFQYPCWLDASRRGWLQPIRNKALSFAGPAVIYPIHRVSGTPLDAYTLVDVVRATLGVGPCEYILDVEGQTSRYKGRATCTNRDTLDPIYKRGLQRKKRAEIEKSLKEVMVFVRHIRGRIETYRKFARELRDDLAGRKKARPELARPLDELIGLAGEVERRVAARRGKIKTPEQAQAMVDAFRRTMLDYEGPDAHARCKRFTAAIVSIGSNQDELVGECRWAVRVLRQRAALAAAGDARLAEVAREIARRTREVLRNPAGHEGARH